MSDLNLHTYNSADVLDWYARLKGLSPAEQCVFADWEALLSEWAVLDIGIGGGRTTHFLQSRCRHYTGIDYSKGFVQRVQQKYPSADLRVMDARNLSAFGPGTFDLVNFSFNGLDYVDLNGRIAILKEVSWLLKPGGRFFFSTHNLQHAAFAATPWRNPALPLWLRTKTALKLAPYYLRHLKHQKKEVHTPDYAILNDAAHHYGLLTFYTQPAFLQTQLQHYGFDAVRLLTKDGMEQPPGALDEWIFVTCVKTGGGGPGASR